jgi:hypothetical protein
MAQLVYKNLLGKSIEAITMAIEIYNKPLTKYRSETSIILIINAWESALKALISKKRWERIYNYKKEESKPFDKCIACVSSHLGKNWKKSWKDSIDILYKERCKVVHYNKGLEILDYMLIQKNIIFFKEFIDKNFSVSIIKDKNWYILPIGTELPFDQFNLLTCQSSIKDSPNDIKKYFEDIIKTHNRNVAARESILMELSVTLQNVNRIPQADNIIGVDPSSTKKTSLTHTSLRLAKEGKQIAIAEFQAIIENYPLQYKDVVSNYRKVLNSKKIKFNQIEFNDKMKQIKLDETFSYNWSNLSTLLPIKIPDRYSYSINTINQLLL